MGTQDAGLSLEEVGVVSVMSLQGPSAPQLLPTTRVRSPKAQVPLSSCPYRLHPPSTCAQGTPRPRSAGAQGQRAPRSSPRAVTTCWPMCAYCIACQPH